MWLPLPPFGGYIVGLMGSETGYGGLVVEVVILVINVCGMITKDAI